jgi:hypothetical protein
MSPERVAEVRALCVPQHRSEALTEALDEIERLNTRIVQLEEVRTAAVAFMRAPPHTVDETIAMHAIGEALDKSGGR